MIRLALASLIIFQFSCSSDDSNEVKDIEDMSAFILDSGGDLTNIKLPDQNSLNDLAMMDDMSQKLEMNNLADLVDMEVAKVYKSFVSVQRRNCNDICKDGNLKCDGRYKDPIIGQIAGRAQYSGKSFVAVRTCMDIPEADRTSSISGTSTFVDMECYCIE